jgi:CO dehydrogenase/acetyl-CoA synthase delta subunit
LNGAKDKDCETVEAIQLRVRAAALPGDELLKLPMTPAAAKKSTEDVHWLVSSPFFGIRDNAAL